MRVAKLGRTGRTLLVLTLLFTLFVPAAPSMAQYTPPNYDNRDENGVDRVTGRFYQDMLEGGIGGDEGVAMIRYFGETWRDNWSGELVRTASGATQYATLIFGKTSDRFTKSGSIWVPDKANGATLVEDVPDKQFTYTAPDGTAIIYSSALALNPISLDPNPTVPQCGSALTCAVPTEILRPNGQKFTLTWKVPRGCGWPDGLTEPPECSFYYRLSDVRSASGFAMKFKYESDTGPSGSTGAPPPPGWFTRASLRFFDLSEAYCSPTANDCDAVAGDWPTVTYSTPSSGVTEISNTVDGTWRIDSSTAGQIKIRRPGATSDTTIVTSNTTTHKVSSIIQDGKTISYNWTTSGSTTTSTATTGEGETDSVASTPTVEQPTTVTTGTGSTTTYTYDSNKRLTKETRPEGDYTQYSRDTRGNVTELRRVAKLGSALQI